MSDADAPGGPAEAAALAIGALVGGRFEVRGEAERGPAGVEHRALDREVEVEVALFLPSLELFPAAQAEAFAASGGALRKLAHPHVRRLFATAVVDGRPIASLQHGARGPVAARFGQGPVMTGGELAATAAALGGALAAGHDLGLVHGWLSPFDLLEVGGDLKLSGVGHYRHADLDAARAAFATTARFVAPETWLGGASTARSDVYGLALLLAELWIGRPCREVGELVHGAGERDPRIGQLIGRAAARAPEQRPAGVRALVAELTQLLADGGAAIAAASPTEVVPPAGSAPPTRSTSATVPFGAVPLEGPPTSPDGGAAAAGAADATAAADERGSPPVADLEDDQGPPLDEPQAIARGAVIARGSPPPAAPAPAPAAAPSKPAGSAAAPGKGSASPAPPAGKAASPPPVASNVVAAIAGKAAPFDPDRTLPEDSPLFRTGVEPPAGGILAAPPAEADAAQAFGRSATAPVSLTDHSAELAAIRHGTAPPAVEPATGRAPSEGEAAVEVAPAAAGGVAVELAEGRRRRTAPVDRRPYAAYAVVALAVVAAVSVAIALGRRRPPERSVAVPIDPPTAAVVAPTPGSTPATPAVVPVPAPQPTVSPITPCPPGMALVDGAKLTRGVAPFCVDRWESPGPGAQPSVVTLVAARAACRDRAARICREAEWEDACRGPSRASFPYGSTFVPGRCNIEGAALVAAGSRPTCISAASAYDMSGNVAEWSAEGWARGGAFDDGSTGRCSHRSRPPDGATLGFRCCADPLAPPAP